jgi:hypothetical protein
MISLPYSLERNRLFVYALLMMFLAVLLILSPAEATLGNVVKIVYLHGSLERISTYAYLAAGLLGVGQLAIRRETLAYWTQAVAETAIGLWLAQFVVSLPAQILAWGSIALSEPRVNSALWILGLTVLLYGVARWMGQHAWMSIAAAANAIIVLLILRGTVDIVHPFNPIVASDSMDIKLFYAAIVLATGLLALKIASDRTSGLRTSTSIAA